MLSEGLLLLLAPSSVDNRGAGRGESLREKMNHCGKSVCECVRFTGGAKDMAEYSSPANQATAGNIK